MNDAKHPGASFNPTRKVSIEDIENYWRESSEKSIDSQGLKPTARDPFLQELIEQTFLRYLNKNTSLLDIGCGEGSSSIKFANSCGRVIGLDYIDAYVSQARTKAEQSGMKNISFLMETS